MKLQLLKFVYNGILAGMPSITYNPITQNTLNVPFTVSPKSLYLNFKLDKHQSNYLNDYINEYFGGLELVPISIFPKEKKTNYLSVNIYNCSSPVFMNNGREITRCEINTYVKDKDGNFGTLIVDYLCNDLSMDPVNVFKTKSNASDIYDGSYNRINCNSLKEKIKLRLHYPLAGSFTKSISEQLVQYSDIIYYKNGIYDKLYYDSSLVCATIKVPMLYFDFQFHYKDLTFPEIDSIFYFDDKINFVGGMWDNIY
jgi:hypothetical protein